MGTLIDFIARPTLILHLARAWRARARGRFTAAAEAYRSAIAIAPDQTNLRVQLGNMLKDEGRRAQAEVVYREAIHRDPAYAETHLQLGHVLKLMGRREPALDAYRAALAADPGMTAARRELFAMGDPAELRAAYERQAPEAGLEALAYPVDCYGQIRRHYDPPPPDDASPLSQQSFTIGVVLAADAARTAEVLRQQIVALKAQTHADHLLEAFGSDPHRREVAERAGAGDARIRWRAADSRSLAVQERAVALALEADWVILLAPGARPHPQALAWVAAIAGRTGCDAIFFDEEVAEGEATDAALRPALRQTFDADSLREANIYGETLAVRVRALAEVGDLPADFSLLAARSAVLLALSSGRRIAHAPLPLFRRDRADLPTEEAAALEHARALRAYLGSDAAVEAPDHGLDARYSPTRPGATISVVIPTKDNLVDLEALARSLLDLADRPDAVRLLILNNGRPQFRQALETAFRGLEGVSVTDAQAPFNWSRLSNQGAAMTTGPFLLFANDDMLMLTRGWDRILRSLLERPARSGRVCFIRTAASNTPECCSRGGAG
jgi:tetratricopeptide (TPR) repeat protein